MYKESIGIIGGFGGYATLNFYKRLLEEFGTGCERDYPRILMDNDFTMPSRTKALIEDSETDTIEIVNSISKSLLWLVEAGADYIILPCGTAHAFLPSVYDKVGHKQEVIDIIEQTRGYLLENNIRNVFVVAAEGTLKSRLYNRYFEGYGIKVDSPVPEQYGGGRTFIEAVKQNTLDKDISEQFIDFLDQNKIKNVILGCTEFPVLVQYMRDGLKCGRLNDYNFIDPLEITISKIKMWLK